MVLQSFWVFKKFSQRGAKRNFENLFYRSIIKSNITRHNPIIIFDCWFWGKESKKKTPEHKVPPNIQGSEQKCSPKKFDLLTYLKKIKPVYISSSPLYYYNILTLLYFCSSRVCCRANAAIFAEGTPKSLSRTWTTVDFEVPFEGGSSQYAIL